MTRYSNTEVEHELLSELKSDEYSSFRQMFIPKNDYPNVLIMDCAIVYKMSILTKNNAIEYDPKENVIRVCKNYIVSKQDLKEEFRRENSFLALYRNRQNEGLQ